MKANGFLRLAGALAAVGAMGVMAGCSSDDLPGIGSVQQEWTIEGTRDLGKCEQYRADQMRFVVFDSNGEVHATEFAPCRDFRIELSIRTGTYSGSATFVDAQGGVASRTVQVPQFTVFDDRPTILTVDFEARDMTVD
jgi:hypothetical protein